MKNRDNLILTTEQKECKHQAIVGRNGGRFGFRIQCKKCGMLYFSGLSTTGLKNVLKMAMK